MGYLSARKKMEIELQNEDVENDQLLRAHSHAWNQTYSFIKSMSLECAIQLGIPDTIHKHGQSMKLCKLIAELPIHPTKSHGIHRLMSILTLSGFFTVQEASEEDDDLEEAYMLTNAWKLLVKDNPYGMAPYLLTSLDPVKMKAWHHLSAWFRNDLSTPFETAHGIPIWEYAHHEPNDNQVFNNATKTDSRLISRAVTTECKGAFEGLRSVVDVGGGTGTLAKAIADSFQHLDCTVLDPPHVVAGLQSRKSREYEIA